MKKLIFILITILLPLLASADANGTCGENLTWSYVESTNTLTISGTGEMPDHSSSKYKSETYNDIWYFATPWYGYRSNIQNVIIESGVTSKFVQLVKATANMPAARNTLFSFIILESY